MSRIVLKSTGSTPEWAMVEMQGKIQGRAGTTGGLSTRTAGLRGQTLGTLTTNELGYPALRIGNQLCEGRLIDLKKPIVLCRKRKRETGEENEEEEGADRFIDVVGTVTKKFLFNNRPQPIVESAAPKPPKDKQAPKNLMSPKGKGAKKK